MAKRLTVLITQNDDRLQDFAAYVASAESNFALRRLWANPDLGTLGGGGSYPLVLFGHANLSNFVNVYGGGTAYSSYISGVDVVAQLKSCNLQPATYPFCVIAGCSSAATSGRSGLFINIGDGLGLPTVGSTTAVNLSTRSDHLMMTPQAGGTWKVYYPDEQTVYALDQGRCDGIRAALAGYLFRM